MVEYKVIGLNSHAEFLHLHDPQLVAGLGGNKSCLDFKANLLIACRWRLWAYSSILFFHNKANFHHMGV